MFGLIIEIGIRTGVWVITKGCQGVYYLCFGSKEDKSAAAQRELEIKVRVLEEKIKMLES